MLSPYLYCPALELYLEWGKHWLDMEFIDFETNLFYQSWDFFQFAIPFRFAVLLEPILFKKIKIVNIENFVTIITALIFKQLFW